MKQTLENELTKNTVVSNHSLFKDYLDNLGKDFKFVYDYLHKNGCHTFDDILTEDGDLKNDRLEYLGRNDFYGCDNGARTPAQKELDCIIGNVQEEIFCIENIGFETNKSATRNEVHTDKDITTKRLDLIHKETGAEVEYKVSYTDKIDSRYNTVKYRHRNGRFLDYIKNKIVIINYVNLGKVAVFGYKNVMDKKNGKQKGSVKVIATEKDKNGKTWDIVSIWTGIMLDYEMLNGGNHEISEKVNNLVNE